MSGHLLGIDVGTTRTEGVLIDLHGTTLAVAARPSELIREQPAWAEGDPEEWWRNVCAIVGELLEHAGLESTDIAAVGVSGTVPTTVLLGAEGALLRRSIHQTDARAVAEIAELTSAIDEKRFFALTGGRVDRRIVAPRLRWLRRHEPSSLAALATLFGSYDYIVYRLTGARGIERNWALEAGLYDLHEGCVSSELLALAGLDRIALPAVRASHDVVGGVSAEAAQATGLARGTPVVAGAADHVASAFAATAYEDGDLVIELGGAGGIHYSSATLVTDPRLFIDHHLVPGKYYLNGCMASSGSLVRWFAEQFCHAETVSAELERRSVFETLDTLAAPLPPGADGLVVLPYFLGERTPLFDPSARGTLIGLHLHHTRHHVYRAMLEGIAYAFRHHVDVLKERGLPIRRVLAVDGGARSDLWLQIVADVLARPVRRVGRHPGSSLGAAIAAGVGSGQLSSWADVERYVRLDRGFTPAARASARYDELYDVYHATYPRLADLYPKLAP